MTASSEPSAARGQLDAAWRVQALRAQEAALPPGQVVASCSAPFGVGGLGRHLQEIAEALQRRGASATSLCGALPTAPGSASLRALPAGATARAVRRAVGSSPPWRAWVEAVAFDRRAARAQPRCEHVIAFNGQALDQLARAREQGAQSLALVAANSHARRLAHQHALAYRRYPLERSWASRLQTRNLREYARAERIYFASSYIRESFLREGFSEEALVPLPLTPDPRYQPDAEPPRSGTFDVVYVGSLTVHKGVPLLVEAFTALTHPDMRLVLVGGWGTRGMRRFIERACANDGRISVRPGDPLPHLRSARLCVHPAYEDGFAYAPAEALACGVPVIVSEDTGMKDLLDRGGPGLVLPTGDLDALTEAIGAAYAGEILNG